MLSQTLHTEHNGMPLLLSVDTNTGYDGVTFTVWAKPFAYRAVHAGRHLGSFSSAATAAAAVAAEAHRQAVEQGLTAMEVSRDSEYDSA